jgi:hypothetical protein
VEVPGLTNRDDWLGRNGWLVEKRESLNCGSE